MLKIRRSGGIVFETVRSIEVMVDQSDPSGPNTPATRAPGLRIGRVRGVPIYLSPLALVFGILIASLAQSWQRNRLPDASDSHVLLLAVITAVGYIGSIVLHEVGHAVTADRFGLRVLAVTVHGFAGFTEHEKEPQTASRQFAVSFSGPLVNGLLAGVCFGVLQGVSAHTSLGAVLLVLGWLNLGLFGFNLAPGLPLDGGGVVAAAVWGLTHNRLRGLRAGAYGGFVVAAAIVALTLYRPTGSFGNLYMLALAGFVGFGAYQSLRAADLREKLPELRAGRLIRKTLPVESSVPLAEALRAAQQAGATAIAVVDATGNPQMVMNGASVDALPEHRRPWVGIADVSRTIEPTMILDADLAGEELLEHVRRHQAPEYLVVQDGRPVGVLVLVDLVARLNRNAANRMARK
jgi:Zn-dependent protease/CBS domain-containing protein